MKILLTSIGLIGLCNACRAQVPPPEARLSNGILEAVVYLPDPTNGYYRGGRFDWSGVMPELKYKGHTFFGQWFETYDPYVHDAIVGPVEAFDPIGYAEANVGGPFIKVGVGALNKLDTLPYHFAKPYPIVDHGTWDVDTGEDCISFTHVLRRGPFPYEYKKVIRLVENRMVITHMLINEGTETMESQVFDHNFFVIDQDSIGPGYVVRFPFAISAQTNRLAPFATIEGREIRFIKALGPTDHPNLRYITGYRPIAADNDITIENRNTGVGVRITCDRPITKLDFWSAAKTLCPEPYIEVNVGPGESFSWTITYAYYTL
ncbi:hypothetical protein [Parapedobacter lycopersici]|uniref:hypothetical protein n=1 Tax=Parapedobacter lycopersici TaxID=1864939 RepID=UPI00214D8A13|nr:hypothetical protein [Parapedobacter lycopersici]